MTTIRRVAIVGANRIPFARSNSVYATASNQDMLTATPVQRAEFGEAGRQYLQANFSKQAILSAYLSLYDQLLTTGR